MVEEIVGTAVAGVYLGVIAVVAYRTHPPIVMRNLADRYTPLRDATQRTYRIRNRDEQHILDAYRQDAVKRAASPDAATKKRRAVKATTGRKKAEATG